VLRWRIRATAVLASLFAATAALADPSPMSAGGLPAPATSTTVALAREELTIDVGLTAAAVKAAMVLENRGPAARLDVGFPCDAGLDRGVAGLDCKTPIVVEIDGKKVTARLRKTQGGRHWMWPMRFAADSRVSLTVSYRSKLMNDRYQTPFYGMGTLHYRLATGASWAGPIGELSMRVDLPSDAIVHIAPAGYTREHGRISWTLEDVEPAQDLAITVHPMYLGRAGGGVPGVKDRAAFAAAIAEGKVKRETLLKVAGEMRKELPELVRYATWFHDVAGKKIGLPAPEEGDVRACVEASIALLEQAAGGR
jgi:hypothetical protein